MKIVIGLGNPGEKYKETRHNIGFDVIDRLINRWQADGPNKSFNGKIYESIHSGHKVIIAKPQTFMNLSGTCVGPLSGFYKLTADDIIVVHDDIDLEFNTIKIKKGGGTGGHNGLKSIDANLSDDNRNYYRVRLGIGRPQNSRMSTVDWVLQQFSNDERADLDTTIESAANAVELLIQDKAPEAMNQFNRKCE